MLDAETRAALKRAIELFNLAAAFSRQIHFSDREVYPNRLQALLDRDSEKGGDGPARRGVESEARTGLPVAGAASTAPPDSAAKIAADLKNMSEWCKENIRATSPHAWVEAIAARVEALGLQPSEREVVARLFAYAKPVLDEMGPSLNGEFAGAKVKTVMRWYNILRPLIAALAPIAEGL